MYGVLNLEFLVNIVLATVKDGQPYARYHIHRGFVADAQGLDTEYLYTTTDLEMPKGLLPTGSYSHFHPTDLNVTVDQIKASATSGGGAPAEYLVSLQAHRYSFLVLIELAVLGQWYRRPDPLPWACPHLPISRR